MALRAARPDVTIVLGGENTTAFWETMMAEQAAIDVCVLGEGEHTFLALLEALATGTDLSTVPAIAWRGHADAAARRTAVGKRIENLDALPGPAWDLFPVAAYLDRGHASGVNRGRSMPVLTSRGCPYQCSFCSSPEMWTTRDIRRSPEAVATEIQDLADRFGVTNVDLNDLTAMLTKDWILEFCGVLSRRGIRTTWQLPSGTRSEAVDFEAAVALRNAGCRNFTYAPESGSQRTLARIKKKVRLPALRASLKAARRAGLTTHGSVVIGFPHERPRDLQASYGLVLQLALDGMDTVAVMVFAPYPGSEEFRALVRAGAITFDEHYFYSSLLRASRGLRSYHPGLSPSQLFSLQVFYLCSFFGVQYALRPWRLARSVVNAGRGQHESVMDQFLSTKARQLAAAARQLAGLGREASPPENAPGAVL